MRSRPPRPVSRPPLVVGDRENKDPLLFDAVDDAVGEIRHAESSDVRRNEVAGTRVAPYTGDCILDVGKKGFVQALDLGLVEIRAFEELPLRERVPGHPNHLFLARILARASLNTSSESCNSTSSRRIS